MEQINLDRLTGIIAFARTASLGSYTAAARSLSISPSAISKSIQRLEQRLGIRVFARTTRSLSLTQEGRELLDKALKLLQEAEEIEQIAYTARSEPSGTLKITAPVPVAIHLIAPYLAQFKQSYPRINIDLRVNDIFTDLIGEGIDLAIRIGGTDDSRLIARKLTPNCLGFYASLDYIKTRGIPESIEDIEKHNCINVRLQSSGQLLHWPLKVGKKQVEILPLSDVIVDNTEALAMTIAGGSGIGLLPTYVAQPLLISGLIAPVLTQYWTTRHSITAIWLESRKNNPNVRAFVDFMLQTLNIDPPSFSKQLY